ncbi:MAG: hypothetical protein ACJAUY_001623 [Cognaticolwellia sp.]|jgi:hypothetical protein
MELIKDYLPFLSLIIAAFAVIVGPFVSYKVAKHQQDNSIKLANKQVIAPMRQVWINNLREDVSEFLSLSLWFYVTGKHDDNFDYKVLDEDSEQENQSSKTDRKLSFLQTKIELMLNPIEEDHKALIRHLSKCKETAFHDKKNEFEKSHKAASAKCSEILKREWERVKNEI